MKALAILPAALALASCQAPKNDAQALIVVKECVPPGPPETIPAGAPPNATFYNTDAPPARYQGDATILVQFASPDEVNRLCAGGKPVCGQKFYACRRGDKIILPNPNLVSADEFRRLSRHELAHVNDWPAYHGD